MSLMAKKPKHKEKQYCNTFNKDFKILKTRHLNRCTAQHMLIYLLFESYNKTHTPEIMHCWNYPNSLLLSSHFGEWCQMLSWFRLLSKVSSATWLPQLLNSSSIEDLLLWKFMLPGLAQRSCNQEVERAAILHRCLGLGCNFNCTLCSLGKVVLPLWVSGPSSTK